MRISERLSRPSWTTIAALIVTLYGALLRVDAYTGKYGPLERPAAARFLTHEVANLAHHLRPQAVTWKREATPYVGGDPITYLQYAREMTSFYQPHVREPVFLLLTRFGLWLVDGQDAGISVASALGSVAVIFATFLLGRALVTPLAGLAAALVMAIEFEAISWGVDGWRDDTFTAAFVFSAWAFVRLYDRPTFANAVAAGVIAGLACLTRITALSFVLPALLWIAVARGEGRRERVERAALALGITLLVVGPYLVSCWIAAGDPFLAINYHTLYYRYSEGLPSDTPMSAGGYLRQKLFSHPVATVDTGAVGLLVRPFVTKWIGLPIWLPHLDTLLWSSSLAGLAMWMFMPRGRLALLILLTSLIPYAFTWNVGGGGQWRFTMHVYSLYVIAAMQAWSTIASLARRRSMPRVGRRLAIVAAAGIIGIAAYVVLPWFVTREAVAQREAANVEAGPRDWMFFRGGWTPPRQDGAVTTRVALEPQTTLHFPLPEKRDYAVALRFDPADPRRQQRVTILLNRQLIGTVLTSWNPDRVGSYPLTLPASSVRAGDNALTLVPDTRVRAGDAGDRFAWLPPDAQIGVRFWYLRVLD